MKLNQPDFNYSIISCKSIINQYFFKQQVTKMNYSDPFFFMATYQMWMLSQINNENSQRQPFDAEKHFPFSPATESAFKPYHQIENLKEKTDGSKQNVACKKQETPKGLKNRSSTKNTVEEDYKPEKEFKKKSCKANQNENRNILPNFINQTLSFIQKRNKSGIIVEKIFSRLCPNEEWTPSRYYIYMKRLKQRLNHYVNQQNLKVVFQILEPQCQLYSINQQLFYRKVTKLLLKNFFNETANVVILTSKRMHSDKRKQHLSAKRFLHSALSELIGEH